MQHDKMVTYASQQIRKHEKNYRMHDLELVDRGFCSSYGSLKNFKKIIHLEALLPEVNESSRLKFSRNVPKRHLVNDESTESGRTRLGN